MDLDLNGANLTASAIRIFMARNRYIEHTLVTFRSHPTTTMINFEDTTIPVQHIVMGLPPEPMHVIGKTLAGITLVEDVNFPLNTIQLVDYNGDLIGSILNIGSMPEYPYRRIKSS